MIRARFGPPVTLIALIAAGACTPASSPQDSAPAWPEGIYGNVDMSEMTGDLGGFEVRLFEEDGRRMAEFVLCEGWCNRAYRAEVARDGDAFRFAHVEQLTSYTDGEPVPVEGRRIVYRLVRDGEGLRYSMTMDGEAIALDADASLLAPLDRPFGLAVAKDEG